MLEGECVRRGGCVKSQEELAAGTVAGVKALGPGADGGHAEDWEV